MISTDTSESLAGELPELSDSMFSGEEGHDFNPKFSDSLGEKNSSSSKFS